MVSETQVLIWTAAGVVSGSLASLGLYNRKRINTIVQRLFGMNRDDSKGGEGHLVRVENKLDSIEERLERLENQFDETQRINEAIYAELSQQSDEEFEDL